MSITHGVLETDLLCVSSEGHFLPNPNVKWTTSIFGWIRTKPCVPSPPLIQLYLKDTAVSSLSWVCIICDETTHIPTGDEHTIYVPNICPKPHNFPEQMSPFSLNKKTSMHADAWSVHWRGCWVRSGIPYTVDSPGHGLNEQHLYPALEFANCTSLLNIWIMTFGQCEFHCTKSNS